MLARKFRALVALLAESTSSGRASVALLQGPSWHLLARKSRALLADTFRQGLGGWWLCCKRKFRTLVALLAKHLHNFSALVALLALRV